MIQTKKIYEGNSLPIQEQNMSKFYVVPNSDVHIKPGDILNTTIISL